MSSTPSTPSTLEEQLINLFRQVAGTLGTTLEDHITETERALDATVDGLLELYSSAREHIEQNCADMSEIDRRRSAMGTVARALNETITDETTKAGRRAVIREIVGTLTAAVHRLAVGAPMHPPQPEPEPTPPTTD